MGKLRGYILWINVASRGLVFSIDKIIAYSMAFGFV
jgi:hypothetical protein